MTEDRKRNRAMKFTKMQGIGNDYVYINCFEEQVESPERLAVKISDRHFGVGSDGLILICPSDAADCRMKMFNADGSEGAMCGNAIRCVGKYVYDHKIVDKKIITVETKGGIKTLDMTVENGKVTLVRVDMGEPVLTSGLPENINILGEDYQFVGISVGNPHAVYFMEEIDSLDLEKIGPAFENHKRFPDRVNTEFVRFIDGEHIQMRVWERGSGETWACGTGATASAVASILTGRTGNQVDVALRGGHLLIEWNRETNHVFMTGPAVEVFTGDYEPV
jgi:diaminopimelate epimerase